MLVWGATLLLLVVAIVLLVLAKGRGGSKGGAGEAAGETAMRGPVAPLPTPPTPAAPSPGVRSPEPGSPAGPERVPEPVSEPGPEAGSGAGPGAGAQVSPTTIHVRVVDASGRPVGQARVLVDGAGAQGQAGTWSSERAEWTLPFDGEARAVTIQARGFRSVRVEGVRADRKIVLQPGLLVRVAVEGEPELPAAPLGLFFQVRPAAPEGGTLTPAEADALLDLLDSAGTPPSGLPPFPRSGFGYLVSQSQTERGLLVPRPGRYRIRWGLLDTQRGTWYSLKEGTETVFDVRDTGEEQTVRVPVTTEAVERTRVELEKELRRSSG
ncbi:MAG: carboxypeptidase-like regulatory domain-containing protein [Planctomycetota bacterium]